MTTTLTVLYDGEVLRPEGPVDLEPNTKYEVTIKPVANQSVPEEDAWDVLESLAGTLDMPADWSIEHDHYLYGTPKKLGQRFDDWS
jgi:hypothetical protein